MVVSGYTSLESMIQGLCLDHPELTSEDALRIYLGQGHKLSRKQYIERGLVLDLLVDNFFLNWSRIVPNVGRRGPVFDWV